MIDQQFFKNTGPYSAARLQEITGGELRIADSSQEFKDIAPLNDSHFDAVSCFNNVKYKDALKTTNAGLCIIHPDHVTVAPEHLALLITPTPYRAYAKISSLFYPEKGIEPHVSPQAAVASSAKIGKNCRIDAFAVIGEHVEIGDDCRIGSHAVIDDYVKIGNSCFIASHVTISHAYIGNHVYIKSGARIGQKGFGFDMDAQGHLSVPQLGRVIIGDHVEIGSNTTVDRGSSKDTIIGKGCRIDNLVQIAHNVELGENCVIVAQVGISGSTKFGKFVIAAGQVGVSGHLNIGDNVIIKGKSLVMKDIAANETVMGIPAIKDKQNLRQQIMLARLVNNKGKI